MIVGTPVSRAAVADSIWEENIQIEFLQTPLRFVWQTKDRFRFATVSVVEMAFSSF